MSLAVKDCDDFAPWHAASDSRGFKVVTPMPETVVHFQIRMPPPMHERLASRARDEKSSLNALIVSLLSEAVERRDTPATASPNRAS
jgi:hypothetical protein